MARIGPEGSTDIGELAAQPRSLTIESLWEDHYNSGWLPLVPGCLWPYQANPALWHFHSLWMGQDCASSQDVMGWKSAGPGADEVKRGQGLFPGQEEDHRQCLGSCTHPQPQGIACKAAELSQDAEDTSSFFAFAFLSLVFSSGISEQEGSVCSPHQTLTPGFPLQRPPWLPLRHHVDSSIWVWDGASEKCFSQGSPTAFSSSGRLSVWHGYPISLLYSTSGRRSRVPQCDWVSLGTAVSIWRFLFTREGKGKTPKKQIKDTASVKANPVHFLISALISQKSLRDLMLWQSDGEGDKADEWQPGLESPPTCEAHSQAE